MVPEGNYPGRRPVRNNLCTKKVLPPGILPPAASNAADALYGDTLVVRVLEMPPPPPMPQTVPLRVDVEPRSCTGCTLFLPVELV
jgi:hypothetical protein